MSILNDTTPRLTRHLSDHHAVQGEAEYVERHAPQRVNGRAVMTIYACPTPQEITAWAESALRNVPDRSLTRAFMRDLIADFADGLSALRAAAPEAEGGEK
ncbi:hypothetical protein [Paracoccus kondratievae]|uniref:Uncharacterized protein n=1 Tax=Paracoccus kondratievae TaxID=135740 RepID=A0AAD3P1Z5_9RHOB|nr:hypothetical protein [Paracoccus kondratievae]GLK65659.1 hypothetical protein GCM10017635_31360 [Paracoccus kondratievae]